MDFAPLAGFLQVAGSAQHLALLVLAVPIGLVFGAVPGLGGKLGIVVVTPFVLGMDLTAGAIFLLALHAVVHTGAAVPAILFGIPGTGPAAATVLDGYPMTKNGEAGRALGAALGASALGGVAGAAVLAALIPFALIIARTFSYPETFVLALFGISLTAALSEGALLRGLIVGALGLMLAFVGLDPLTAIPRFALGQLALWDGIDLITAVIGVFAVPEMIELGRRGGSVAAGPSRPARLLGREVWRGAGDAVRHIGLTARASGIGAAIGLVPGLGGEVAAWVCYGHAVQSAKDPSRFGKGAVEGVIAPEAANNSKEGGALVPTLFLGIPGSSGMAVLLVALTQLGLVPGPAAAAQGSGLIWALVWALVLANLLAALVLAGLGRWLAALSHVRWRLLVPVVFLLGLLGSYLSSQEWRMLVAFGLFGLLGVALKSGGWPRAPFVVGIVLGAVAEDALNKTLAIWGPAGFLRPGSLILLALIAAAFVVQSTGWRPRRQS